MQSYTRHQLKQDKFADATKGAVHWTVEHRNTLVTLGSIIAIAVAAFVGWSAYLTRQEDAASVALGIAVRTYTSAIRPAGEAAQPDAAAKTYASVSERSAAAFSEFKAIADKYPRARNGHYARYLAGVSAIDKGDSDAAEAELKKAGETDKNAAALAKFALAGLYRSQNKTDQAANLYREVVGLDAPTVSKSQAQLALAEMYEAKNPGEAVKVYEQIIKDEQANAKALESREKAKTAGTPPLEQKSPLQQKAETKIQQLKAAANKK